jgi:SAM-dependent methyltransferase
MTMAGRMDDVWKSAALSRHFVEDVRGTVPLAREQIDVMMRLLESRGAPLRRFVDLGCGSGVLGSVLLERWPESRGVFLDFSDTMLEAARANLAPYGDRAQVLHGDFAGPGWRDALLEGPPPDAVVSGYAIHHQPDERKRTLYREIHDLLAPGGWFVNVEHVAPGSPLCRELFDRAMIENLAALYERRGAAPDEARRHARELHMERADKEANVLTPVETQCRRLRELGYEQVDCYIRIYELAVFGGQKSDEE